MSEKLTWPRGDDRTLQYTVTRNRDGVVTSGVVSILAHGMVAGTQMTVVESTGVTLTVGQTVYLVSPTDDTFLLSSTVGGTALAIGTGSVKLDAPVLLSSASIRWTAKFAKNDTDEYAAIAKDNTPGGGITVTSEAGGKYEVAILPEDTLYFRRDVSLYADTQVTEANGRVTTVWEGTVDVTADVTRTQP